MKPRSNVIEIKGSLGGEITRMEIDQSALVHIMSVLTNLYSNTELAVIREYSTNALDSHIFAGQSNPIRVYTPNEFTNEFVVQDFGLGLSKDEIQNVYGNYGTSTKRDSDDVAGCLGLGSKSALAYTSAFTVVGVKDGAKTTALISLGEDGAGRIEIVDESETNEPNGVTVRVPSAYRYDFKDEVKSFFKFWDKGTVLVNDEEPDHFTDNMTQIDDVVWVSETGRYESGITVVMGSVSYEVDEHIYNRNFNNRSVVVMADMGEVDFVPSREALHMTPRTKEFLSELSVFVAHELDRIVQEKMDASDSCKEVIELAHQKLARNKRDTIIWKGVEYDLIIDKGYTVYDVSERRSKKSTHSQFHVGSVYHNGGVALMINKPYTVLSGLQRDKLEKYFEDNNLDIHTVYYIRGGEAPPLARDATIIDFNDIVKVKVGKRARGTGKPDPKQLAWEYYAWDPELDRVKRYHGVVDPKKTIMYLSGANAGKWRGQQILEHKKDPDLVMVTFYANRITTFTRGFPNALRVFEYATKMVEELEDTITEADWLAAGINRSNLSFLTGKTIDPKIDELWNAVKTSEKKINEYRKLLEVVGQSHRVHDKVSSATDYVAETYPLVSRSNEKASIEYVNMMYAIKNGKDNA